MGAFMKDPEDPFSVTRESFVPFNADKPPLLYPGVYIFLKKDKAVYVGESGNIPRRLKEHRRKKWFEEGLEIRILWCADDQVRLVAETVMILRERPRFNRVIKIGLTQTGRVYGLNFLRSSR
jgi:hypothetical protein